MRLPLGSKTTIFNNVEYLPYFEDGNSILAPTGFIASTLSNWEKSLQKRWRTSIRGKLIRFLSNNRRLTIRSRALFSGTIEEKSTLEKCDYIPSNR